MANYTEKAIINEFDSMLWEKPFHKLTVSALVARCQISPNTFYYHFQDIYDLLEHWLGWKKEQFLDQMGAERDWRQLLRNFLLLIQQNPKVVNHLMDSISRERLERYVFTNIKSLFLDYFQRVYGDRGLEPETLQSISELCCFACLGVTLEFIWDDMKPDVDTVVARIDRSFDNTLRALLRRAQKEEGAECPCS